MELRRYVPGPEVPGPVWEGVDPVERPPLESSTLGCVRTRRGPGEGERLRKRRDSSCTVSSRIRKQDSLTLDYDLRTRVWSVVNLQVVGRARVRPGGIGPHWTSTEGWGGLVLNLTYLSTLKAPRKLLPERAYVSRFFPTLETFAKVSSRITETLGQTPSSPNPENRDYGRGFGEGTRPYTRGTWGRVGVAGLWSRCPSRPN